MFLFLHRPQQTPRPLEQSKQRARLYRQPGLKPTQQEVVGQTQSQKSRYVSSRNVLCCTPLSAQVLRRHCVHRENHAEALRRGHPRGGLRRLKYAGVFPSRRCHLVVVGRPSTPIVIESLGEAKSTDQSAKRFFDTWRGQPKHESDNARTSAGPCSREAPAKPPTGGPGSTGKAARGGPGSTGKNARGGPEAPAKVAGFRVYTFVIATSVRVINCREKQLWRPSVSALPEPPDLCYQSLADRSDGFGLPGWYIYIYIIAAKTVIRMVLQTPPCSRSRRPGASPSHGTASAVQAIGQTIGR